MNFIPVCVMDGVLWRCSLSVLYPTVTRGEATCKQTGQSHCRIDRQRYPTKKHRSVGFLEGCPQKYVAKKSELNTQVKHEAGSTTIACPHAQQCSVIILPSNGGYPGLQNPDHALKLIRAQISNAQHSLG